MSFDAAHFDAVVLAGGTAARLGGVAKPQLTVGGETLLDRVVRAVAGATHVIVVGPRQPVTAAVSWAREEPPGGGPVAGLAAALPLLSASVTVVLAADLPWIAPAVPMLLTAVPADGVAVLASAGRVNYLAAAWRLAALRAALAGADVVGGSVRQLLSDVAVVTVDDPDGWGDDVDTHDDLDRARNR